MENQLFTMEGFKIDDLSHSGIKGQKWGIRRWQNPDGSLTPAGRERYRSGKGGKKFDDLTKGLDSDDVYERANSLHPRNYKRERLNDILDWVVPGVVGTGVFGTGIAVMGTGTASAAISMGAATVAGLSSLGVKTALSNKHFNKLSERYSKLSKRSYELDRKEHPEEYKNYSKKAKEYGYID